MIASLIFMSVGNNEDKRFNLVFSDINIGEDGPSKMLKPRLQGNDSKNQPYNIIADSAVQINQDSVELSKAIADITLSSGAWLSIKADKANANIKLKQVELIGNVNAFYDNGNEMRTERAFIDLNSGTIKGDMPITGQGEKGTIRANSFIVVDHGKKITFNGKVRVKIFN